MKPPLGEGIRIDRRDFIRRIGLMSLGAATGCLLPDRGLYALRKNHFRLSETRNKLGTFLHITILSDSKQNAKDIVEESFDEVDRLSNLLNRHQEGSTIWLLNQRGSIDNPPPELIEVIQNSIEWNQHTRGYFDITVEPIVSLFHRHFGRHRTPPPEEMILERTESVGSEWIHVDETKIRFGKEGMGVTLDGIAKGYIVDRAMEVIRKNGVKNALINAGGDIRTIGGKEDGNPWTVAIQDPFNPGMTLESFGLRDGAVATSGNYQVYYDREKVFHHIVNPSTGRSPLDCASSTVRSERAMEADALSTALFVMNPDRGIDLIDRIDGVDGLLVTRRGKWFVSRSWEAGKDFF